MPPQDRTDVLVAVVAGVVLTLVAGLGVGVIAAIVILFFTDGSADGPVSLLFVAVAVALGAAGGAATARHRRIDLAASALIGGGTAAATVVVFFLVARLLGNEMALGIPVAGVLGALLGAGGDLLLARLRHPSR